MALGAAAAALVLSAPAAAISGDLRTLVVLGTWGPEPYTQAQVQQEVFTGARDFLANSSFGQLQLVGDVTPWLQAFTGPVDCEDGSAIATRARDAAAKAGYRLDRYARFIYLVPAVPCRFVGRGTGNEVLLIGEVWPGLVAHELGHTFGLGHANRWECRAGRCQSVEYGDLHSVMGGRALGQFDAYEKYTVGWLTDADVALAQPGTFSIDQLELPSGLPQALVIETATTRYWIDHREPVLEDADLAGDPLVDGVFVHAGPSEYGLGVLLTSPYPTADLLIPNPSRPSDGLLPGDAFTDPGAFTLTVLRHEGTHVDVDFRWTDTSPPRPPRIDSPGAVVGGASRQLEIEWRGSTDLGSGVERYELWIDAQPHRFVDADFRLGDHLRVTRPKPGRHGLRMVAIDRAGNRSSVALKRFVVTR